LRQAGPGFRDLPSLSPTVKTPIKMSNKIIREEAEVRIRELVVEVGIEDRVEAGVEEEGAGAPAKRGADGGEVVATTTEEAVVVVVAAAVDGLEVQAETRTEEEIGRGRDGGRMRLEKEGG